tara:strand:- start:24545 stop:25102 length:558 start_codon:yes stop_codon:yes gene_type:complete
MDLSEIHLRLQKLESKDQIRSLVSEYAEACDQQDLKYLEDLFTENAEFASLNGMLNSKGRTNIIEMYKEVFKTRGPSFHWTHDVRIDINANNSYKAKGTVYSHAETTRDGVASLAAMRYDDEYSKKEGRWKFSKRTINFFYYVKTNEYVEDLLQRKRVTTAEGKVEADIPESVPAWVEFQQNFKK